MHADTRKLLWDAHAAAERVARFLGSTCFDDYQRDELLRSAVERQLEIIGDALSQLRRVDPETAARITDLPRIVGLRNVLIHAYATVDHRLVWGVVESHLGALRVRLEAMLSEA